MSKIQGLENSKCKKLNVKDEAYNLKLKIFKIKTLFCVIQFSIYSVNFNHWKILI